MRIAFEIPGEPQGKQRPRWGRFGTYTPTKTKNYETYVKELFATQFPGFTPVETPFSMIITIYVPIPKSMSKKKRELAVNGDLYPGKKPDIDNIEKIILDALEGLAYKNDNQCCHVVKWKLYGERPRVKVVLRTL